jgi:hypothetical protein
MFCMENVELAEIYQLVCFSLRGANPNMKKHSVRSWLLDTEYITQIFYSIRFPSPSNIFWNMGTLDLLNAFIPLFDYFIWYCSCITTKIFFIKIMRSLPLGKLFTNFLGHWKLIIIFYISYRELKLFFIYMKSIIL